GEGAEQRPEIEAFVDGAHAAPYLPALGIERGTGRCVGARPEPEDPGETVELGVVVGQRVHLPSVGELERVLGASQEPVRGGEPLGVVAVDIARLSQLSERVEGGAQPEGGVGVAVDQLEELDRELDVADAALTELEIAVA